MVSNANTLFPSQNRPRKENNYIIILHKIEFNIQFQKQSVPLLQHDYNTVIPLLSVLPHRNCGAILAHTFCDNDDELYLSCNGNFWA